MVSLFLLSTLPQFSPARAQSSCDLTGPVDAPFTVPVRGEQVQLILEIWMEGADPAWVEAILSALEARNLPAVLVFPARAPDEAMLPIIARTRKGPFDFAVTLPNSLLPRNKGDSLGALKEATAPLVAHTGRLRTIYTSTGARQREGMLGRAGFRSFVSLGAPPSAEPRMASTFEGQPRTRVVLPPGLYEDRCGPDPLVGPFGPKAADRAAVALQRATRIAGAPVVRVALDGRRGHPDDATVLGRWLDEIVLPGQVVVVTAEGARKIALAAFRRGVPTQAIPDVGGRLVAIDALRAAADALRTPEVLPRTLPGDLNPTEAFFGFVLLLADRTEGTIVRLGAMSGPANATTTSLAEGEVVSRDAVRAAAVMLADALPTEVPAAFSLEGRLVTAGELLLALAAAVRGEDPIALGPVAVPEPNERGLGWGVSTLP